MSSIKTSAKFTLLSGVLFSLFAFGATSQSATVKPPRDAGVATTATEVISNKKVAPMLSLQSSALARSAVDKYVAIVSEGGWNAVPRGSYKRNAKGKGVIALNNRLFIEGYVRREAVSDEFVNFYTAATEQGVARFQRNHGLAVTGKVDAKTLTELNVTADARLRTLQANLARIDVYAKDLGERYLLVNIPSATIETVNGSRIYSRHNAIVGRPERPTPVVMTPLETIRFNPYWNAPVSIVEADIFPKLRSSTQILEDMNMKVFDGYNGPEVDPSTVDWKSAIPDDYHFRQEPGPESAMATAKVEFKSPFGIYLHDTPEKHLFKSGYRLYSSGCVRVEQMPTLVNWVLNGQDAYGTDRIAALAETLERVDVALTTPPQLRVMYLTAWPTADGTVAFRKDVYDLDASGFTVGQPMPVGQLSDEGLRYVLKPVPRLASQIDADEAEGFGMFKKRKAGLDELDEPKTLFGTRKKVKGAVKPDLVSDLDDEEFEPAPKKAKAVGLTTKKSDEKVLIVKKPITKVAADKSEQKTLFGSKAVTKTATKTKVAKVEVMTPSKPSFGVKPATATKKTVVKKTKVADKSCRVFLFGPEPKNCKVTAKKTKVSTLKVKAKPTGNTLKSN